MPGATDILETSTSLHRNGNTKDSLLMYFCNTNKAARNHNDTLMIRVTDLNIVILFYCYQYVRACLIRQHNKYVTNKGIHPTDKKL